MNSAGHSEATAPRGLELTPFRGLRYDPDRVGNLAAVTSPPYNVVTAPTVCTTCSRPTRTTSSG
ncbi:hypothetical protein SALBM311S_07985 [Streptomyces alboniger]